MTTYAELFAIWTAEIKPAVIAQYGENDHPALAESWNDYTDAELSGLHAHYCPAYDDSMPDSDQLHVLTGLGVTIGTTRLKERTDGNPTDWDKAASHWDCLVKRGACEIRIQYSQGSAHGETAPDLDDVMYSLLMDASYIACSDSFEEWAENMGMDTDSRKAEASYKACQKIALELSAMFTKAELNELDELFADF